MEVIEIHEIPEGCHHTEGFRIHVPGRTRFHPNDEGPNPPHGGIVTPDLALKLNHLVKIPFFFKRNPESEIEVAEDLMLFKLFQGLEQAPVGISETSMGFSQ